MNSLLFKAKYEYLPLEWTKLPNIRNSYLLKDSCIIPGSVKDTGMRDQLTPANLIIFYDDPKFRSMGHWLYYECVPAKGDIVYQSEILDAMVKWY